MLEREQTTLGKSLLKQEHLSTFLYICLYAVRSAFVSNFYLLIMEYYYYKQANNIGLYYKHSLLSLECS